MSTSKVISIRAPEKDWETWDAQAAKENKSRNNWIRLTLNDAVALSKATKRPEKRVEEQSKAPTLKDEIYPQERAQCVHRLMPGTFCKRCGVTK